MINTSPYTIYPCGDHAITIELDNRVDVEISRQVISLYQKIRSLKLPGVLDIIPAYSSVTIVYDLRLLTKQFTGASVYETMHAVLQNAANDVLSAVVAQTRLIRIPVCYDTSLAPDIVSLAALHQLTVEEVIQLHTAVTYRVYMIGFLPGFAYMGSVEERIITPRKESPRTNVPAGSVGIAGEQTGIYPFASPGGWQLIGQTPLPMFAVNQSQPCYLQPGDAVQFFSISVEEFFKTKQV